MPTVFDNSQVAHIWAQQNQDHGRSHNGNFYFEGPALYSYGRHYLVGFVMPDGFVLLNADSNSVSTNRHKGYARSAVSHKTRVGVPDLTSILDPLNWAAGRAGRYYDKESAQRDFKAWAVSHVLDLEKQGARLTPPGYGRFSYDENGVPIVDPERAAREEAAPELLAYLLGVFKMSRALGPIRKQALKNKAAQDKRDAANQYRYDERDAQAWAYRGGNLESWRAEIQEKLTQTWGDPLEHVKGWSRAAFRSWKWAKAQKGKKKLAAKIKAAREEVRAALVAEEKARAMGIHRRAAVDGINALRLCAALESGEMSAHEFLASGIRWNAVDGARDGRPLILGAAGEGRGPDFAAAEIVDARERAALVAYQAAAQVLAYPRLAPTIRAGLEGFKARIGSQGPKIRQTRAGRVKEAQEAAAAARLEKEREARESWLSGAGNKSSFYGRDAQGGAYLRAVDVERDESGAIVGGRLQTSQGAEVPLTQALRVFRFLKHCRETSTEWTRNGRLIRVGPFQVDRIDSDGTFRAGCHLIQWAQVEALAARLDVLGLAPDSTVAEDKAAA